MIEHELIQPYIAEVQGGLDAIMGMNGGTALELMRRCCLPMKRATPVN